MRALRVVFIVMVVSISLGFFGAPVSAASGTPDAALATCQGQANLRWSQPTACWAWFGSTTSRAARLVLHPDPAFEGRLTGCALLPGNPTCHLYLSAMFVGGRPVGRVEGSAAPKLLPAGDWYLRVSAGDNNPSIHVPPIYTPAQAPRVCPLGPVFDPYCWYGVGGGVSLGGGSVPLGAHGPFAGSVVAA